MVLCKQSFLQGLAMQVVDGALGEIAKLQGLTLLTLDYCQRITDGGLAALGALPSLRTLNLRGCEAVRYGLYRDISEDPGGPVGVVG